MHSISLPHVAPTRFLLFALLLVLPLTSVGCGSKSKAQNKNDAAQPTPPPAVEVSTATAIRRELPRYLEATGSLAADEQSEVASLVSGKVIFVGTDVGNYIERGAVLVRLDDSDARIRLTQSEAAVAQAEAGVRQARARLGLNAGQQFDPNRVAEVGASRAALELAEKQLRRFEKLLETGDVSRAAYDQQKAQRDQLRSQYEAQLTAAQQSYAAVQTAQAGVDTARTQVAQSQKAISDTIIRAPISGFVSDRAADIGEYISPQSKIATIVRTNPLRVRIDVPEQEIDKVRPGQSVSLAVSSFAERNFNGRVVRAAPGLNTTSRTLTVEAEVENGSGELKPGQFVTVRILLPESEAVVLVPQRAVKSDGTTARVYVIKDGRAQERLVQLGATEGEMVAVRNGIQSDELVATSNVDQLTNDAQVRQ